MINWYDNFAGVLLGGAVGDAIGLPREGLSPRRALRMFGGAPLHHQLLGRRGMISDDTEHACLTAQALLCSRGDPERFARSLAWRLRGWLVGVPAGIGLATLRSILKLWIGFSPASSGVYSAGNGPAMRAPILGIWAAATGATPADTARFVEASTRMTHTDPRASEGALVVALAAAIAAGREPGQLTPMMILEEILPHVRGDELRVALQLVQSHLDQGTATQQFVESLGLRRGVTGYIVHTVPVALYCWLRWPTDFRSAVEDAVLAGGDTDTVAAIVGGLASATQGIDAIPPDWLGGLVEWPRSRNWMLALATRLASASQQTGGDLSPLPLFWPGLAMRNPLFIAIVLTHGFRRLLPPY